MANQEHLEVVRQGADAINEWRKEHLGEHLDLRQADLRRANLWRANLWRADLRGADLQGARFNWYSRELISEWLRQDAGNNPLRLGIVGVAGYSDMCWRDCIRAIRNSPLREEIPWARARITLARRNERRE